MPLLEMSSSSPEPEDVGLLSVTPVLIELDEGLKGKLVSDLASICDVSGEEARHMLEAHKWNMQVRLLQLRPHIYNNIYVAISYVS